MPDHQRHLLLWQRHRESPYCHANLLNPVSEHFLEACRLLFTNDQLRINPWFEAIAKAYTENSKLILMGAASSGKSHSTGLIVLLEFLTDPQNVYACLTSTSKDMLLLRTFASCIEYLNILKSNQRFVVPFKFVGQKCAIVPESQDFDSVKTMIKGIAIRDGSTQDARASLMGVHTKRVISVADELENYGERAQSFLSAQDNLSVAPYYKQVILFNPQSTFAPGCMLAEPRGGWSCLDPETATEWDTEAGYKVLRFDGHKSPGLKNPTTYPFLPTPASIAKTLENCRGNPDSPGYWTFVRSWPPPQEISRTVLTEAQVEAYKMKDRVIWRGPIRRLAACDPAFTSEGDDAVYVAATLGHSVDGVLTLEYDEPRYLKIEASSEVPITQQLVDQIVDFLIADSVKIEDFGVDDSGTQSIGDMVAMRLGNTLYRVGFGSKPPDIAVSVANAELASHRFRDVATWMYYTLVEYAQYGQIKGMPNEALKQICGRRIKPGSRPLKLETKADYKKRVHGKSPDEGDACVILAALLRERLGVAPGSTELVPQGVTVPISNDADRSYIDAVNDIDNYSGNYIDIEPNFMIS